MHTPGESVLVILLVGLIAGWLAGKIVAGGGLGLISDIVIGIVGAFTGGWIFRQFDIHIGRGIVSSIIVATIGAMLLLVIVGLLSDTYPRRRLWLSRGFLRRRFW
jgi:uncharacterized membrane protein YeaQ/YmgE (transglycosylase-associated protein family)